MHMRIRARYDKTIEHCWQERLDEAESANLNKAAKIAELEYVITGLRAAHQCGDLVVCAPEVAATATEAERERDEVRAFLDQRFACPRCGRGDLTLRQMPKHAPCSGLTDLEEDQRAEIGDLQDQRAAAQAEAARLRGALEMALEWARCDLHMHGPGPQGGGQFRVDRLYAALSSPAPVARAPELRTDCVERNPPAPDDEPEHQCGGPKEACCEPGCRECGTPKAAPDPVRLAETVLDAATDAFLHDGPAVDLSAIIARWRAGE
jgi:hypothetical protein